MRRRTFAVRALALAATTLALAAAPAALPAQGRGNGGKGGHGGNGGGPGHSGSAPGHSGQLPPGQAKKVSSARAVSVSRDIFTQQGYKVVRVERVNGTEVIYYRRGNMGRGRGLGPVERMVIRPVGTIVVFEAGPSTVVRAIKMTLGL